MRKDPKTFEMVTKKISHEGSGGEMRGKQRRRMKKGSKRGYSDKIPEWVLEKEEEEEIRKRTPSPSISSISSTSTTDSDSTFVRLESLCPTTSSMSNLVDAMACSSPHEKLIVDLRDSLFMLLHGLNKTKEMAISSLKEREQTAAQILFWMANLALHSFDEEKELPSLANLSPHIVLFSEHMVICIALHSDCSSSDDSDSSSVSSSTVVTSASDDDDDDGSDSLPSSAFEDEDDYKKECLRWKAPELLNGAKKYGTKKTVEFSIGMLKQYSLTVQKPFQNKKHLMPNGRNQAKRIQDYERQAKHTAQYFQVVTRTQRQHQILARRGEARARPAKEDATQEKTAVETNMA
ncbi:uncharacterized protein MONOS_16090 [Monocercomonoides exilis]|uniref:uncharacterized protein n=1 Tax=Monocercomonoides exilis TaxID=2049356 RepID=UPI0035597176|nr:hypothetical protein MONOS_16090 [Monocercomonoides exilis]|eukprot:MONOS_16090.1-p1 / transcript=MONOS_16090.1 / gene=MONOS_16090 / organism=Monocercomonoides_exilis_PA203 / gene_product=unspecified product / transcript_product=unspecified product / location=Mono_scaffold01499:2186-3371(+) / protein_length=349 / sequence_SO=supercontig / SO=protein_coding / is_pseudo=false